MKKLNKPLLQRQQGVSTLILSSIILFGCAMLGLFATKYALLQKGIQANQIRINSAEYHANQLTNQLFSHIQSLQPASLNNLGLKYTTTQNELKKWSAEKEIISLQLSGYSRDKIAEKDIAQQYTSLSLAGNGNGKIPFFPLIVRQDIRDLSELRVSNFEQAKNIWLGGKLNTHSPHQLTTYIWDNKNNQAISSSSNIVGKNIDIIEQDYQLAGMNAEQLFENFINLPAWQVKRFAKNHQKFWNKAPNVSLSPLNGLMWIESPSINLGLTNQTWGSPQHPVIAIVDVSQSKLVCHGNLVVYGMILIRGNLEILNKLEVHGALIVDGSIQSPISGSASQLNIQYDPKMLDLSYQQQNEIAELWSEINASWRDFL